MDPPGPGTPSSSCGDGHGPHTHNHSHKPVSVTENSKESDQTDENFNSFHYWRPPLPDISGDLEMLQGPMVQEEGEEKEERKEVDVGEVGLEDGEVEEAEEEYRGLDSSQGPATSSQIQKVLDCLQPHMDDPDVQGESQRTRTHIHNIFIC